MPCLEECGRSPTPILKARVKMDSESDGDESVTSSECTDPEHSDDSDVDDMKARVAAANRKTFNTKVKFKPAVRQSLKKKKRVTFKTGDKLVLIYEIPNRAMLGLKSDSETSEDSGDDDDDDEDDDEDDDDDDNNEDDDEGDESESDDVKKSPSDRKLYPKRTTPELKEKRQQEKVAKLIGLRISPVPGLNSHLKRNKVPVRPRPERKERRLRVPKKDTTDLNGNPPNDARTRRMRRRRVDRAGGAFPNLRRDADKSGKARRAMASKSRFLELKTSLQQDPSTQPSRVMAYKQDLKPAIATLDSHGGISVNAAAKQLPNRPRIQPATFRLAKTRPRPETASVTESVTVPLVATQRLPVRQVVSASLDETSYKRLDPDCMNATNKRFYAWQVANGNITTNQLRTPSILPFLDSLQTATSSDSSSLKFPT